MNKRPWLEVAVYVRVPAADAPIATAIAAKSDVTLMNSQSTSVPAFAISTNRSTIRACAASEYAQINDGRHMAIASAIALHGQSWFNIRRLPEISLYMVGFGEGGECQVCSADG